jgi:hypothetical protein
MYVTGVMNDWHKFMKNICMLQKLYAFGIFWMLEVGSQIWFQQDGASVLTVYKLMNCMKANLILLQ